MNLSSNAFAEGGRIPKRYTCDGEGVSPPLSWDGAPFGTKSYALVLEDPDAPRGPFTHWIVWNIPLEMLGLEEGGLPSATRQGVNDAGSIGYAPPCPPRGTHRYVFTLYALDSELEEGDPAVFRAHALKEASLTGLYARSSK
ncbi:MAG: YbhB/YbcL family Raf kinase inhibitor-like protein [Armatimonadota bacterium]